MKRPTPLSVARGYTFGLRDYEGTKANHAVPTKYDDVLKSLEFSDYEYQIMYNCTNLYFDRCLMPSVVEAMKTGKCLRKALKALKMYVNSQVFSYHAAEIADATGLADSTARKYATKYYVMNYRKVNADMKRAFMEIIKAYL